MLKNKLGKKVAALASAAVMAASATATGLSAVSLTAFAGNELGEGTFQEGAGLPWHVCENATGKMNFDIKDGIYAIEIENPGGTGNGGEDRWDCQFRHRNLTIEEGHTYRLTYSVNPTNSGRMYAKLGDMTNDDSELWHNNGKKLQMEYKADATLDQVVSDLKNASYTGEVVKYYEGWDKWKDDAPIPANQWSTFAYEFKFFTSGGEQDGFDPCTQGAPTSGTGEWTFHMGGMGRFTQFGECFPAGTIVRFDNLALVDMTDDVTDYKADAVYQQTGVEVNQVGYYPNAKKQATLIVEEGDSTAHSFVIKDASQSVVYEGTTDGKLIYDKAAWNYNQIIDFTDFTEEGEGYTIEVDGKTSLPFDISANLLDGGRNGQEHSLLTNAINYFYQNRSGMDTEQQYITSNQVEEGSEVDLWREGGHKNDTALVTDEWVYIYNYTGEELSRYTQSITANKGWYDAGDYGKYVLNGGISLWTLMNMYERSLSVDKADKWADGSGTVVIPETGNGIPDILDECKYELDFFLQMQREDGMVYHKLHDFKWTGLAVAPSDKEQPTRIVKPVTYGATLNFAAACAQGARLFEPYDPTYAQTLKDAAIKAYAAAQKNYAPFKDYNSPQSANGIYNGMYAPMLNADKGGGAYGDDEVSDEFYWAACELYITTGDKTYYTELKKLGTGAYGLKDGDKKPFGVSTILVGGENNNTCSLFTWGTTNSAGSISMYVNSDKMLADGLLTEEEAGMLTDEIIKAGDYYLSIQNDENSAYASPYEGHDYEASMWSYDSASGTGAKTNEILEGGYEWGSNSMVINNTMALALAYDETGDVKYIDGVTTAFDYLLGRNPIEQSYVTGYGEHSTQHPHHRWWSGQMDNKHFPFAPAGVLSGGPNSSMQDPMVQGLGYKIGTLAPMKCYLDNVEAWSVNECTINWNSPLCWVVSFIEDEAPNITRNGETKPSETKATTTSGDETTTTAATTSEGDVTTSDSDATTTASTESSGETTTTSSFPKDLLLGDVNLDGKVDLSDVVLLNKAVAGSVTLEGQAKLNADCNSASGIDAADSMSLLKFLVHLINVLPE